MPRTVPAPLWGRRPHTFLTTARKHTRVVGSSRVIEMVAAHCCSDWTRKRVGGPVTVRLGSWRRGTWIALSSQSLPMTAASPLAPRQRAEMASPC